MKKIAHATLAALLVLSPLLTAAATANDASSYVPYTGLYAFGTNMGYYGTHLKDEDVARLAYNAGARTVRPSLPDWLITGYGTDARIDSFKAYAAMGMTDLTAFVGEPNDPAVNGTSGPDNRETKVFPGASERAKTFKGLYEPIWLDSGKTQINPANTYAAYLYKTVKMYGPYVKFWEIVNEPDFTYTSAGWQDKSEAGSWWSVNPNPDDLANLKAPIFYYIRELRVAYDVIKTLEPTDYVATGGIGYASFLDAVLRNTDNPVDGSVTAQYPLKGGAYFDVLSFHTYPMYSLRHWDNGIFDFVYTRHSDAAVDVLLDSKKEFADTLRKYGYGTTYPEKQWINTETDLPQIVTNEGWGSIDSANNYIVKASILAEANGIRQIYKYGIAGNPNPNEVFSTMGLYGDLTPSTTTVSNAPRREHFKAFATVAGQLYGKRYDAAETARLSLPANVRGAAFRDASGTFTYALWAKTSSDKSEIAIATYTFPFQFSGTRRDWDYSSTNQTTNASSTVTLSGFPSYFTAGASTVTPTYPPYYPPIIQGTFNNQNPVANAGPDTVVTPSGTTIAAVLTGSGVDYDGTISQYYWNQVSGPSIATLSSQVRSTAVASNLVRGTYVFRLFVIDNKGGVGTDDISVYVGANGRVMVNTNLLNVRATAGGTLVNRVRMGNQGLILDTVTTSGVSWNKVQFDNGILGWVSSQYLSRI